MAVWARDTPWRQGHVLSSKAAKALVGEAGSDDMRVVVISHDCDLAQEEALEPNVDVLVGRQIASPDGNFSYAKNVRRLHLTFTAGDDHIVVELVAGNKTAVPKHSLADHQPEAALLMTVAERAILQRWLAARYRRAAFPDEFDRRLSETGLRDRLGKILKPTGSMISAIFFDVDDGEEITRTDINDPYKIAIYLLYSTELDPEQAEASADKAAKAIASAFREKCRSKSDGSWHDFELVECEPLSDQAMTIRQAEYLKRWSTDHMSLRSDDPHAILEND